MPASALGLIAGLIAGVALAFGSFGDFLIVLVIGALGFLIGRVIDDELDLTPYLGGRRQR